ncbi:MAG: hypothetical protein AVDCRST_MAG29-2657, partial [uncultured Nocardioidaceae bacterium]
AGAPPAARRRRRSARPGRPGGEAQGVGERSAHGRHPSSHAPPPLRRARPPRGRPPLRRLGGRRQAHPGCRPDLARGRERVPPHGRGRTAVHQRHHRGAVLHPTRRARGAEGAGVADGSSEGHDRVRSDPRGLRGRDRRGPARGARQDGAQPRARRTDPPPQRRVAAAHGAGARREL